MKCLSVLTNQLFAHLSKPRTEHSAKRTAITKSNSNANEKNTFLTIYIYFSGKTDLNQRIPLLYMLSSH
jgi:hypothetical protein